MIDFTQYSSGHCNMKVFKGSEVQSFQGRVLLGEIRVSKANHETPHCNEESIATWLTIAHAALLKRIKEVSANTEKTIAQMVIHGQGFISKHPHEKTRMQ